ncbi:MAG: ACP S-malonyltransferase [Actinomycetota bacterium]|nr:ACP S-malonyltransferase [Actinomycetota bacterium]
MSDPRAALFPGQGVDARDVLDALPEGDPYLSIANEVLRYPLRRRVLLQARRPAAILPTLLAQPAIFVASSISWRRAAEEGAVYDLLAGHSLGEYAALVAAGSLTFREGLEVVAVRAAAMHAVGRTTGDGMVALIGLELSQAEAVAAGSGTTVANDNAPGQQVVSGSPDALAHAGRLAREMGGRAVLVKVSGAFHSPAMAPATGPLREALAAVELVPPSIAAISNVDAQPHATPAGIRKALVEQLTAPVQWRTSLERLWDLGARSFDDIGPGRVVGGLARRTFQDREVLLDA